MGTDGATIGEGGAGRHPWRALLGLLGEFGLEPRRAAAGLRSLPTHWRNRRLFRRGLAEREGRAGGERFAWGAWRPCLHDRRMAGGVARGHYFHMDLHVAQRVFELRPRRHVDVGSRVDGFVAHVASFRPVEVVDIRPVASSARNISFVQADLMAGAGGLAGACDSVSCLHALEHFGLGRYGDPVDAEGHLKGWRSLHEMLEPGGRLHFAVPMGPLRVEFDAHRVFSVRYLLERMIDPLYEVAEFSYVGRSAELVRGADCRGAEAAGNFGCTFGCAIFELVKRA